MSSTPPPVPPDFGGFIATWLADGAYLVRYGHGEPQAAMHFTPLNLLQVHKLLGQIIEQGEAEGRITAEHRRQSERLPNRPLADTPARADVDQIVGPD